MLRKQKYCKDRQLSMLYNLLLEIHKAGVLQGIFLLLQVIPKFQHYSP